MQAIFINIFKILTALSLSTIVAGTASAVNKGAEYASATLKNANGQTMGVASFTEDATGLLRVKVDVKGLSIGLHGIHIHAVGNCSHGATLFSGAGGHHNPLGREHGLNNPLGAHAGDLHNLEVNASGAGHLNDSTDRATLSPGPTTLLDADGSTLVIHVAQDDQVTNPTGNSGAREVCGVIKP